MRADYSNIRKDAKAGMRLSGGSIDSGLEKSAG